MNATDGLSRSCSDRLIHFDGSGDALLASKKGYEVIMWRLNAPSFSVYYGRPTPSRDPIPGDIVLTKTKRLAELPGWGSEVLYSKNGIVLVRVTE